MAPASGQQTPTLPFPSPSTIQPSSLSRLTLSDKLLLSQAVHHIGTSPPDWGRVSSILLSHPLIKTKSRLEQAQKAGITLGRVFGSRECERAWVALMRQYNLVLQPGEKDPSLEPEHDPSGGQGTGTRTKEARGLPPRMDRGSQLALAQYLYAERIREIQDTIKAKETEFRVLVDEIDKLNAGNNDDKLLDEMERLDAQREQEAAAAAAAAAAAKDSQDDDGSGVNGSAGAENTHQASRDMSVSSTANSTPIKSKEGEAVKPSGTPLTPIKDQQMSRKSSMDASKASESPSDDRAKVDKGAVSSEQDDVSFADVKPSSSDVPAASASDEVADIAKSDDQPGVLAIPKEDGKTGLPASKRKHADDNDDATSAGKRAKPSDDDSTGVRGQTAPDATATDVVDDVELSSDSDGEEDTDIEEEMKDREMEEDDDGEEELASEAELGADDTAEAIDDGSETASAKRPEPRRSRRSARNVSLPADEDATRSTPPTARNTRVEALRSREASGNSVEPDESGETVATEDGDGTPTPRLPRGRSSISPVSARRGKSISRPATAPQRRTGRGSSTGLGTANDESLAGSDAEREPGGGGGAGHSSSAAAAERAAKDRKMEKVLMLLLGEVSNHTHGNLFHAPIKESDAPDYYQLIRHPLDLKTIKSRIKEGRISTSTQLRRALMQMFANSLIYNRPGSDIHRMALEMRDAAEEMLDRFEQTQLSASYSRR